jgi:hypothetical protein
MTRHCILALLVCACTDAALQPVPPPPPPVSDNLLLIRGEVCSEPPSVTPFPVKLLFVLDQSTSFQCTDPFNRRFEAVREVIDELKALPNASFGFIGFSNRTVVQEFTQDLGDIRPFFDGSQGLGPATDYQGALATTVRVLEEDMVAAGPAERARTRYVIIFVSDGIPVPRCVAGCEDDTAKCSDGIDNDGDGDIDAVDMDCDNIDDNTLHPDNFSPACNFDGNLPEGLYEDLAAQGRCPDYNQPHLIAQRVEDLRTLEFIYSVGEIVLHTVFVSSPDEVIAQFCGDDWEQLLGFDLEQAHAFLTDMARVGGGTFRDVNLESEDTAFLEFDFTSLKSPYAATEFVVGNLNTIPTPTGMIADSDADGLSDAHEVAIGTRADTEDSDGGDGYTDLFEYRYARSGFDALDGEVPALPCQDTVDTDGDGLRDCEEDFLGTDPGLPDTDGDHMLDGLELRIHTDPLIADADRDPDFDGVVTRRELQGGTSPTQADAERYNRDRIRYELADKGAVIIPNRETEELEERRCYDFEVSNIELAVTRQATDRGRNRIYLHVYGEPLGLFGARAIVRQACVEVRYPGVGVKRPASGVVDISAEGFGALRDTLITGLEPITNCFGAQDIIRPDIEDVIHECLPVRQQVGRVLFTRDELVELVRRYYDRNLELQLPLVASDLFWPIEIFEPDLHCYRAWEVNRILDLLRVLGEACEACRVVNDAGLDGGFDGGFDAGGGR